MKESFTAKPQRTQRKAFCIHFLVVLVSWRFTLFLFCFGTLHYQSIIDMQRVFTQYEQLFTRRQKFEMFFGQREVLAIGQVNQRARLIGSPHDAIRADVFNRLPQITHCWLSG